MDNINEYDEIYICSPTVHQDKYQKHIKGFSNYTPIRIFRDKINEADIVAIFDEIVNDNDFQKSDIEIETDESIEELKHIQDYYDGGFIIFDDSNEKEMNDFRVKAMFKRSRHKNFLS